MLYLSVHLIPPGKQGNKNMNFSFGDQWSITKNNKCDMKRGTAEPTVMDYSLRSSTPANRIFKLQTKKRVLKNLVRRWLKGNQK